MEVYKHLQIGSHHLNNCEDFLISQDIGENKLLLSVMDGCTMGKESHFASTLIGKLLRKLCRDEYYKEYTSKKEKESRKLLKDIFTSLFLELNEIKNQLNLDKYELLSTLILGVLDTDKKEFVFIVIGDGLAVINGDFIEFDQDNIPDYLGYHLNDDFEKYYNSLSTYSYQDVEDVSLSTDGVFTFSKFREGLFPEMTDDSILYNLFVDRDKFTGERKLIKVLLNLEEEFGLKPTDDIGIIRVVLGPKIINESIEWDL